MNFFLTVFFLLLIISVLVSVHEFGHFLAAKLSKIPVQEFAIGFGPKVFSKKIGETVYALNLLPLGGYVQLEGETEDVGPNSFRNKKFRYKAFVLLAGVTMNIILAIFLLAIFLQSNGYKFAFPQFSNFTFSNTESQNVYFPLRVTYIDPQGPSKGQLNLDDFIVGVDNQFFKSYTDFQNILKSDQNRTVTFQFLDTDTYNISLRTIHIGSQDSKGAILGVGLDYDRDTNRPGYYVKYKPTVLSGISMTYDLFFYQIKSIGALLRDSIRTGNYEEVSKNVGSLPAIANQVDQAVELKAYAFLIPLTAVFSINLAMINVLPFPALDGGQLFVAFIEKVRRKKVSDQLLTKINTIGFIVLLIFGFFLMIKDVIQLNWLDSLGNFIKGVFGR